MKININWNEPIPKATGKQKRLAYANNSSGQARWVIVHNPASSGKRLRWFLYCMTSEINFSAFGSTFAEAEKNWLDRMQKHIDACQQLMADIKAGKNV